ncbi:MAG: AAA family ATPase [Candidatus Altiarchaeum hamiconexum]|uniref:AAA family ATPase n=1 Tax=Candidatus Altarchaeum hamiconexum TaxID=1803513 RepID=A0A8J8CFE5_9ARCH|nr:AAA family ATPase [Candidatus Altarchaeum hamiconexum]OIQ05605.1 MAG: hypothetical protein AUK59_03255 [Candidatus Altarchaeum sp. CG2_30_32_3053]PIN66884.1 MAG: hypothetical protein COV98_05875 [Candidatus Altarchaeum sp. CG12_big_fil_rev_8_21_14_0_65_33_22]PIV28240.1 MAG: hypothetical protein COS36_02840 [Candidatus Altarchaeum sp. CG03_land_8_20_14_0_80_32_618]PIZ29325.1 MAG: hypothetical protein COY41_05835 [Candidatus Altarchaeum sp. CG_4_10_14_0_8_um_filter_32_851]PJC15013.1 MAG: hypo
MFPEKYAPKRPDDITDKTAAKEVSEWIKNFELERGAGKKTKKTNTALMLSGNSGVGKTALINALANEYNYEILYANKENIEHFESYAQMSGLFNKRLIVIDNAETINFKEILNFIATSKNPIIVTTTDAGNKKFQGVTKFCKSVQMRKPTYLQVSKVLEKICVAEGIAADKKILDEISKNACGNIRSALIDLEVAATGRKKISETDLILETRDITIDIFKGLQRIFKAKNLSESVDAYNEIDEEPRNMLLWFDENIPEEYKSPEEIEQAYYLISRADVFLGRITNRQYWGFLRYVQKYIVGISTAKNNVNFSFVRYKFPSFLSKMSRTKAGKAMNRVIGRKISPFLHIPPRLATPYILLFSLMLKKGKSKEDDFINTYKFNDDEMEYLRDYGEGLNV